MTRTVLWALYCVLQTPNDFWTAVIEAMRVGGDTDTVAAIAGAVSGAYNGPSGIVTSPAAWKFVCALHDATNEEETWDGTALLQLGSDLHLAIVERERASSRRWTLLGAGAALCAAAWLAS